MLTQERADRLIRDRTLEVVSEALVDAPIVSVCVVTYNHAKFVRTALDGVFAQQGDVSYDVVIGDDCSVDGTTEVVLEYAARYPDRTRVLLAERNLGEETGNGRLNFLRSLRACRGRYVAYLEADDYWTSPLKLRRQVDMLEARPDLSMCFHRVDAVNDVTGESMPYANFDKTQYGLSDLVETNRIPTASVVARRAYISAPPEPFLSAPVGDWLLHVLCARHGGIGFLDEVMGVYRVHSMGVSQARRDSEAQQAGVHRVMCELLGEMLGVPGGEAFRASAAQWAIDEAITLAKARDRRAIGALVRAWRSRAALPASFARVLGRRTLARVPRIAATARQGRGVLNNLVRAG